MNENDLPVGDEVVVVLTDEDGVEHEFRIVQVLNVDMHDYAILLPLVQEENHDVEAVILRIDVEGGEDVLVEIEDDDEFERVAEAWDEYLDECEYGETP